MHYLLLATDRCYTPSAVTLILPFFFFFNDTATTEIYTLSLHDALPISTTRRCAPTAPAASRARRGRGSRACNGADRKSTRLNSSHGYISYAVFCLKKKTDRRPRHPSRHEGHRALPRAAHRRLRAGAPRH